jgi:hypothetical protein
MPTVKRATGAKSPARAPSKKASPAGSAEIAPGGTGTKKLIVAEKPSVAADIARALGGFTKQGDYFESDDYVLSSAIGHLLETRRAGGIRRQARQVEFHPPAHDSAAFRAESHREDRGAPQAADPPDQAQGRHRPRQRL